MGLRPVGSSPGDGLMAFLWLDWLPREADRGRFWKIVVLWIWILWRNFVPWVRKATQNSFDLCTSGILKQPSYCLLKACGRIQVLIMRPWLDIKKIDSSRPLISQDQRILGCKKTWVSVGPWGQHSWRSVHKWIMCSIRKVDFFPG